MWVVVGVVPEWTITLIVDFCLDDVMIRRLLLFCVKKLVNL